jgi:stress response protein YsnF
MSRTVTTLFDTREEADWALYELSREVSLAHGEVIDRSPEGTSALARADLNADERAACERDMAAGEYMLLAQVNRGESSEHILEVLERIVRARDEALDAPRHEPPIAMPAPHGAVAEERIPIVEEELRVGKREVVRGGARVHARVEEHPVVEEIELIEERATLERRPATRRLEESELEAGGLLRERVIEISQIREEAVVTKEAFVREEVLVKKSIERRTEQIRERVRRTEVETERLQAGDDRSAFPEFGSGDDTNGRI